MIEEVDTIVDHVLQIIDPTNWGMKKIGAEVKTAIGQFLHRPIGSFEKADFRNEIERIMFAALTSHKILDYQINEIPRNETLSTDFQINILPRASITQYVLKVSIG